MTNIKNTPIIDERNFQLRLQQCFHDLGNQNFSIDQHPFFKDLIKHLSKENKTSN